MGASHARQPCPIVWPPLGPQPFHQLCARCGHADGSEVAVEEGTVGFTFPCTEKGTRLLLGWNTDRGRRSWSSLSLYVDHEHENLLLNCCRCLFMDAVEGEGSLPLFAWRWCLLPFEESDIVFQVSASLFRGRDMVSILASCEIPSSPDCGRSLINAAGLGP